MRIAFVSYDTRIGNDIIHIQSPQHNVMLLNPKYSADSQSTEHPYIYCEVLGILHANVSYIGPLPDLSRRYSKHRVEFLWVRYYDIVPGLPFRLDTAKLRSLDRADSLGFIDPSKALRAAHFIPCFGDGRDEEPSVHPWIKGGFKRDRWSSYYVNKYV